MTETQLLMTKIAALRQRLEQAQLLACDAGSLLQGEIHGGDGVALLERKVALGEYQTALLEQAIPNEASTRLPTQLTARAMRLLRRGRELLGQLRLFAEEPWLQQDGDPLAGLYRETAAMTDAVLRSVQTFPESATAQMRLCEGLEVVLGIVAERLANLQAGLTQMRLHGQRLGLLAELFTALAGGQSIDLKALTGLAEALHEEAQQGLPLHYFAHHPQEPAQFIAAHALTTAQVIARLVKHDLEWRGKPLEPVLACLVHDVGMMSVAAEVLAKPGPLDDAQRRLVEAHPHIGAEWLAGLSSLGVLLAEVARCHHERLDGTGYPGGLRDLQLRPLVRLISVCDTYAALCCPRPYRPALDSRTALTDTLMLAEKGWLDRHQADKLLQLTFYPVGSLVELADGAIGLVVATHPGRRELTNPGRPVVALLTDSQGQALPAPRYLDLAECDGRSILRGLPTSERALLLGKRYPEWV